MSIGKQIVVVGVSASGKSTFARKLSEKISMPVTHMDSLMWKPNWEYIGDEETVRLIAEVSENDEWLIEGYIEKEARVDLFNKADRIIYLDYPGWVSAWRYVQRWWKYRKNSRPELPGCPEKFSFKFLKLVYTKGEVWKLEKLFRESNWDSKIVRLKHPGETDSFLSSL
jgi:adenylate kinase family enzyme